MCLAVLDVGLVCLGIGFCGMDLISFTAINRRSM